MRVDSNSNELNNGAEALEHSSQPTQDFGQHELNDSAILTGTVPRLESESQGKHGASRFPGQRGRQKRQTKVLVTMRFSREVLNYFKASGEGWQTRMNDVLKQHVAQQESGKG